MICARCGSDKVNVQIIQTGSKTKKRRTGCLWGLGRLILIICTLGLWLLVGKRKGTDNTKVKNETKAICQNCGHTWDVINN